MFSRTLTAVVCHKNGRLFLGLLFVCSLFPVVALSQNGHGGLGQTRLLRTPTVSANQIGFAYANNIWVAPRAGGSARRLTSFQGQTANPHFSPDGRLIAFSGETRVTSTFTSSQRKAESRKD